MSVSITTMGMYWPAFGTGGGPPQIIVDDGGGSGIGTLFEEKRRPVINVERVYENGHTRRKINIEVISVTEN